MQIFVRTHRTLVVHVEDGATVLDVKRAVELREGIPCEEQRLVYGGKQLRDTRAFSEYGIGRDSTLHLLLRLVGGKGGFGALLRSGARGSKTENFDACRDLSGRRLRHVNADKQLAEWAAEAQERELEKVALKHIKDRDRAAAREVRMEIDTDSVRVEQQQNLQSVLAAVHDALATNGAAVAASNGLGAGPGAKRSGGMGLSPPPAAKRLKGGYMPLGLDGSDSESDTDAGEGGEDDVSRPVAKVHNSVERAAVASTAEAVLVSAAARLAASGTEVGTDPGAAAGLGQHEPSAASLPTVPPPARSLGSSAGGGLLSGPRLTGKSKAVISTGGSDLTTAQGPERQSSVSYPANSHTDGGGGGEAAQAVGASVVAAAGAAESALVAMASAALSANGPGGDAAAALSEAGLAQESHINGAAHVPQAEMSTESKIVGLGAIIGADMSSIVSSVGAEQGLPVVGGVPAQLDLEALNSVEELEGLGLTVLKAALQQRGLKCGGNAAERAARLWLVKSFPLEKLDRKHFAKAK